MFRAITPFSPVIEFPPNSPNGVIECAITEISCAIEDDLTPSRRSMASSSSQMKFMIVDVNYGGVFGPKPLVYVNPVKASIRDVDFTGMGFREFVAFLEGFTKQRCTDIYFCPTDESLQEGIKRLGNDNDYKDFIQEGQSKRMGVYVDHFNEPILDWVEEYEEESEEEVVDDVDSDLSDPVDFDHEEDEVVPKFDKTVGDPFLNKLVVGTSSGTVLEVGGNREHEEGDGNQLPIFPVHDENQEWNQMMPIVGMKFSHPTEMKQMLSNYAVANGYDLYFEKNDKERLLVRCCRLKQNPCCPFRLYASWMQSERSFQIKSLRDEHKCSRSFKLGSIVTYKWIGKHFVNEILVRPKMSLRKMKWEVSQRFNLKVSVSQCRNARRFALQEIEGSLTEHYEKLWSYANEIRRSNPGSTVKMDVDIMPDSTTYFSKYYVCFKGVKDGWIEGCRRVISLDGCFLKGICRGELLAAVGRDSNNHIYPIAWAVVAVENKETWKWFIDLLLEDLGFEDGRGLTFISDQHKGLLEAVKELAPEAEHRNCARHVLANFKKRGFKSEHYRKLFWVAANATTVPKFEAAMKDIKNMSKAAHDHLMERNPKGWSKAFYVEGRCCDANENGISESFNAAILDARKRPIITMLEEIRIYIMERLFNMKKTGQSWDLAICPSIRGILKILKGKQRFWSVTPAGFEEYEVRLGYEAYSVNLNNRTCGCRSWQLKGIPCVHAMAAISNLNRDAEQFVAPWFTVAMFGNCYRYSIHPLNGSDLWPHEECPGPLPPKKRRLPGRPCTKRKRDQLERESKGHTRHTVTKRGMVMRCSICRETGHNKLKCPQKPTDGASTSRAKPKSKPKTPKEAPNVEKPQVEPEEQYFEDDETDSEEEDIDLEGETDVIPDFQPDPDVGMGQYELQDEDGAVQDGVVADPPGQDGVVGEDGVVQDVAADLVVGQHQPPVTRVRKASERIIKLALRRKVTTKDGSGESQEHPVRLE